MSRKSKILLTIVILGIIVALIFWFFFFKNSNEVVVEPIVENEPEVQTDFDVVEPISDFVDTNNQTEKIVAQPEAASDGENNFSNLRAIALSFVERFGSFSNQGNYENFVELEVFMTDEMKNWSRAFIAEQKQQPASSEYYGVSTKVLSSTVVDITEQQDKAIVELNTQRIEYRGSNRQSEINYQKIIVELNKFDDVWYVQSAQWQ